MQKVTFYKKPCPHIIIDEFLSPRLAKKCLDEAILLEPKYNQATILGDDGKLDDCPECQILVKQNRTGLRNNQILDLDDIFKDKRDHSFILHGLQDQIVNNSFIRYLKTLPGLFPIMDHTTTSETLLSAYGKCDFYSWHTDTLAHSISGRILTLIYYFNKEPVKFKGGDLIITGKTIHEQKHIKAKHNRCVIFESANCVHGVDNVTDVEKFEDNRFSVNFWIGFEYGYKYR